MQIVFHIMMGFGALICGLWFLLALRVWFSKILPRDLVEDPRPLDRRILVSVVVPFRNEESALSRTLEKLEAQTYADLEVVAVDDRSNDRSSEIAAKFSAKHDHFHHLRIDRLPEAWIGKSHALHQGFLKSSGELVLFMDADSQLGPRAIELAVKQMERDRLDHLSVAPLPICHNFIETCAYAGMWILLGLFIQVWRINDPACKVGAGVGAFNFARRTYLEKVKGFEPLRLEIVDDMGLAYLIRLAGGRSQFAYGGSHLSIRYQEGIWGLIKGIEKNAFAASDFSWPKLLLTSFGLIAISWPMTLMLLFGPKPFWQFIGLIGFLGFYLFAYKTRYFPAWWTSFCFPFVGLMMSFASLRSGVLTTWRGGVRWRDTFYPTELLKKSRVYNHEVRF